MPRKIRIASVVMDLYIAGGENRLLTFAQNLDRSRFEHIVISICQQDENLDQEYGPMRRHFRDAGIEVLDLGEPAICRGSRHIESRWPRRILRSGQALSRKVAKLAY